MALFLDFDGTLVEIAEEPGAVRLDTTTRDVLARLADRLEGAMAIVTGREIEAVDHFLAPMRLPVAGVHGLVRRDATGAIHPGRPDAMVPPAVRRDLEAFVEARPGLHLERKAKGLALHYRLRPEAEADCRAAMQRAVAAMPDYEIKQGKMVFEAKPAGEDKGTAIAAFMAEAPFFGRLPVFAGDDVTDEDAFAVVNRLGGVSIKIGTGETLARFTLASTAEFLDWLASLDAHWSRREQA